MSYSSLSFLQRFPVEPLKIDQSFVAGMAHSATALGIVKTNIAISQSLSLAVAAVGIETPAQRQDLVSLGCRYGQGYLLARPMTAQECTELLRRSVELLRG